MWVGNLHFWVKSPGSKQVPTHTRATSIPHTDTWETAETLDVPEDAVSASWTTTITTNDDGRESESCRGMSVPAVPEVAGPSTML